MEPCSARQKSDRFASQPTCRLPSTPNSFCRIPPGHSQRAACLSIVRSARAARTAHCVRARLSDRRPQLPRCRRVATFRGNGGRQLAAVFQFRHPGEHPVLPRPGGNFPQGASQMFHVKHTRTQTLSYATQAGPGSFRRNTADNRNGWIAESAAGRFKSERTNTHTARYPTPKDYTNAKNLWCRMFVVYLSYTPAQLENLSNI